MLGYIIYQLVGFSVVTLFWFVFMQVTGQWALTWRTWAAWMASLSQNNGVPLNATDKRGN